MNFASEVYTLSASGGFYNVDFLRIYIKEPKESYQTGKKKQLRPLDRSWNLSVLVGWACVSGYQIPIGHMHNLVGVIGCEICHDE